VADMSSKPVETLYRVFFDEMKFAKQQQWTVTNYLLLLIAAVLGVTAALKTTNGSEKTFASFLLLGVVIAGWYFLLKLQFYMAKLRERIERIEDTFTVDEKKLLGVEKYASPGSHGLPFTVMMIAAITTAAVVVGYVIWTRL